MSVDMDNYEEYRSLVDPSGDPPGRSFYADALPRFLDLLEGADLRATFFMLGRDALRPEHRSAAQEIVGRGHEVGNHSHTHPYDFAALPRARKLEEIAAAEEAIAAATGERPVGFRTPSSDVDLETLEILAERGYAYDSSVFPSPLMLAFMLYGKLFVRRRDYRLGSLSAALLAPGTPYRPAATLHRRWEPGMPPGPDLLEIPISVTPVLRLPFYATFQRLIGPGFFRRCLRRTRARRGVVQMSFHLMDLVDLGGTSLHGAIARSPGLGVPFARRRAFVAAALGALAATGENVTLRELAAEHASRAVAAA